MLVPKVKKGNESHRNAGHFKENLPLSNLTVSQSTRTAVIGTVLQEGEGHDPDPDPIFGKLIY